MESERKHLPMSVFVMVIGLLSQNLMVPVLAATFEDQKNYYSPDPHGRTPPSGSHRTPSHRTPSHGTPSHGSGGSYNPTPSAPSGGGSYNPTPSTPSGGGGGGGAYYRPPPSPTTPIVNPPVLTPPTTPIVDPPTVPSPPFPIDPNTPLPGTCTFWKTHPAAIWGLFGWWGTVAGAFGVASVPGFGSNFSLPQALSNTRTDGFGDLYREGTASLLNSMVDKKFPFTTQQVRDHFAAGLASDKAARAQAQLFKMANEGRLKRRN
ncbi:hypothetical protein RJ641_015564 [Dillenia turbinata]|uniref:Protodermal factor 1 n=1 Tax=Dillenia turbinata TaxID=194707 RepID=A0AAN8UPU9_9MAGN